MDMRKQKPNAVGQARKAWAFTSVFAAMGSLAGQFSFWKPQTFKGAKPMRPAPGAAPPRTASHSVPSTWPPCP